MPEKINIDDILTDLQNMTNLLGHPPSYEEAKKYGKFGSATYQRRLGPTWEIVKRHVGWKADYETYSPSSVSPEDGSWLSGIIDGEGCFRIQKPSKTSGLGLSKSFAPVFTLSIRLDDRNIIDEIFRILETSKSLHIDSRTGDSNGPNANPAYKINIRDLPCLAFRLIPILERYPLRSKKQNDFILFKQAVNIFLNKAQSGRKNMRYTEYERKTLEKLYHAMQDIKKYQSSLQDILLKYNLQLSN